MTKNLGIIDRVFRFVLGIALLYFGYISSGGFAKFLFILIGLIAIVESFISYCWLYQLFGINTCGGGKK